MFVPVVDKNQKPLMPTRPSRAAKWIKSGKATPFWSNGVFCVRLNREPSKRYNQEIAVGVDPGSQKEGFTVKSESHTYFNVQADAHNKVCQKVEKRRELRRGRRSRKCPNRKNRANRLANKERIPAGTRARWDWKLRILDWFSKLYPITHICVEDIKARTVEHAKKWNTSFSPLEVGKQWFYAEIEKRWELRTLQGWQIKEIRDRLGLKKSSKKLSETFDAHCVDSWCLAHYTIGGTAKVDNTDIFCLSPIPIQRRTLHREQPKKGGIRSRYGGTVLANGLIKHTLVKHAKHGLTRLAGINAKRLFSLYNLDGKRLTTNAKENSFKVLTRLNFNYRSGHSTPT
ncbi:MAG: RRXRR domain-containing protein [Candidatus Poribacteria bacterium]|nr:RRXRR domain-containing protein [Candidatus Poribacteria bacterium]